MTDETVEWDFDYDGTRYYPGADSKGRQVLFLASGQTVYAHWFDELGNDLRRAVREVSSSDSTTSPDHYTPEGLTILVEWMNVLGVKPAIIRVRKFESGVVVPGPQRPICDQPMHFEDGDLGTDEQRERQLRWRDDLGAFVLVWNTTEHWIDGKGEYFQ